MAVGGELIARAGGERYGVKPAPHAARRIAALMFSNDLAGFEWFHGSNDIVDSWTHPVSSKPVGYDLCAELMAHFIHDVRKDLGVPNLPFVIGVMGLNGLKSPQSQLR